jgi:hypothetical protein
MKKGYLVITGWYLNKKGKKVRFSKKIKTAFLAANAMLQTSTHMRIAPMGLTAVGSVPSSPTSSESNHEAESRVRYLARGACIL